MATILLTDDEAHVRHVIRYRLERAGHTVLTASNGEEGLERAQAASPDLVVSDQQMPRMHGLELCRALSADPATSAIPIILVTSREFEIGSTEIRGTNVKRVMSKPFSPKALLQAIEEVLSARLPPTARPDAA